MVILWFEIVNNIVATFSKEDNPMEGKEFDTEDQKYSISAFLFRGCLNIALWFFISKNTIGCSAFDVSTLPEALLITGMVIVSFYGADQLFNGKKLKALVDGAAAVQEGCLGLLTLILVWAFCSFFTAPLIPCILGLR